MEIKIICNVSDMFTLLKEKQNLQAQKNYFIQEQFIASRKNNFDLLESANEGLVITQKQIEKLKQIENILSN